MKATTGLAWCAEALSVGAEVSVADCARLVEVGEGSIDGSCGGQKRKTPKL